MLADVFVKCAYLVQSWAMAAAFGAAVGRLCVRVSRGSGSSYSGNSSSGGFSFSLASAKLRSLEA
jgi:hypothetical protein